MTLNFEYGDSITDQDWGCELQAVVGNSNLENIVLCHVCVSDLKKLANELIRYAQDTSWMTRMDSRVRRSYDKTASETADALISIFENAEAESKIGSEFGELMVSIGSTHALEKLFGHIKIPIAELWKPQLKQNEGFDFHTVCPSLLVNFGEAKYSAKINPHGDAIDQAKKFLLKEKHLRDRVHLINLADPESIDNLDGDRFGVVAAFSINSSNPLSILKNAYVSAVSCLEESKLTKIYLIGVSN